MKTKGTYVIDSMAGCHVFIISVDHIRITTETGYPSAEFAEIAAKEAAKKFNIKTRRA